jgi:hypothetical protein
MLRAAALVTAAGMMVFAQWLDYPTPNIPRLPNGAPNFSAPAPKTAAGQPDFSGIWTMATVTPPNGMADYPPAPEFFDIGASLEGGLPYQPWAAALVKQRMDAFAKDDPIGLCQPAAVLRLHTYPPHRKMIQLPNLLVILSERDVRYRQIFIDGRALPEDPEPSFTGYSTANWDGDVLVVRTNGFRDGLWLDRNGSPMTDAAKVTERIRRPDFGRLEIELTVDDAKAYTKPWTVTLSQKLVVDTDLLDYFCQENEKDVSHLVGK